MFQNPQIFVGSPMVILELPQANMANLPIQEATLIVSSPNFVLALVSGVIMAFAFQLLLTNLAIATVISPSDASDDDDEGLGSKMRGMEAKVGFGLLISVSLALFAACFFAVKLSMVGSQWLGAITAITIWSAFFFSLVWLGSTAVGSLLGSLLSTVTSGLQDIMGTATSLMGANMAKTQAVSTAEEITAAVRRELTTGLDTESIQKTIQSSLGKLQLPNLDLSQVGSQFETLLKETDLKDIGNSDLLKGMNRQTFIDLARSRTDLSEQDVNRIADQLEGVWKRLVNQVPQKPQKQLLNLLQSATSADFNVDELTGKLDEFLAARSGQGNSQSPSIGGLTNQALQVGLSVLLNRVLQNTNLSDLDLGKLSDRLQSFKEQAGQQLGKLDVPDVQKNAKPSGTIQADVEDYLLFSQPWKLNRETVKTEFKDVIYDPEASPGAIRQELEVLNRGYFVDVLSLRDDFAPEAVQELADQLDAIRAEVFDTVQATEANAQSETLRSRVEDYLKSTGKEDLNPDAIAREFKTLLEDPEASTEALGNRLSQLDRETLTQILQRRQDIDADQLHPLLDQLEGARDRVVSEAKDVQERVRLQAQELRDKVATYLRDTQKDELNPEGIQRDLKTLFDDPEAGVKALQSRLSQFDRDTLVQLLSQRQDLDEEQANKILDQVESVRDSILQAPQKVADTAKEQYEKTTTAIADYLRKTNLEELSPEGIQQDLSTLLGDPKAGTSALRDRLSQIDRDTLVKLLSQQDNLSEEQVNNAIDQIQSAIRNIVKAPRRLANRAQEKVADFETNLETYLRNTNKEELNPDGIKRDLQTLLQHPREGLGSLGDRVTQFDRDTLVALLSQREDISEEEANRIADQVESTYQALVDQIRKIQQTVQATVDGAFAKVRDYLNSLERPELNYEGIQQDFAQLFDDPQVGVEALRDRVSHFDRETLVAVISSREDISEEDANQIVDRLEATRDTILHQTERIQQETQKRLKAVKQQAAKQVIETRKMAAGAAWWLFGTGLVSLAASAIAGMMAIDGLDIL